VSLVHAKMRTLRSHAHTEAVRPAAPTVDDALRSPVVLAVHGVAASVLGSRSEGRSGLRHDLAASTWVPPRHPGLLVLGSLGQDVVLDTNLLLVGNGVNSLLGVLHVWMVHVECTLGGWPRHVLGRRGSTLLIRVLEPRLLARLVGLLVGPTTGVRGVGVGHGKV
jgi:hypothetical protein